MPKTATTTSYEIQFLSLEPIDGEHRWLSPGGQYTNRTLTTSLTNKVRSLRKEYPSRKFRLVRLQTVTVETVSEITVDN